MNAAPAPAGDPRGPPPPQLPPGDLWVFAYGSLLWRPGFDSVEQRRAQVFGYHRALCVWSWYHRGDRRQPGLVCGLDSGGSCLGQVLRVAAGRRAHTLRYLYAREMVTPVYRPHLVRARTARGVVPALTFTVDREHRQYAGQLSPAQLLATVREAAGNSGRNRDYVLHTARTLRRLAIRDATFEHLARKLGRNGEVTATAAATAT